MVGYWRLFLIAVLLFAVSREAVAEASLVRTDTGRSIAQGAVGQTLAQSGVFARLDGDKSLSFLGLSLSGAAGSAVFLNASAIWYSRPA